MLAWLRNFHRSQRGVISVEAIMILPILIWAFFGSFTIFEAFRQRSISLKATYTIADMLSRQIDAVGPDAIDGLNDVFEYLTFARDPSWIRVTSVYWDKNQNRFRQKWSRATHDHDGLTDTTLQDMVDYVPAMASGDTVLLVESYMPFRPVFDMGLASGVTRHVIVTRPRFASQVIYDPSS
ncbi:TadE/TadG family type IV pilus assembly protein [Albidovulum sp.]|uniref:TadE/TadG family type IV pilus assembly protein n=1 Tax=Albidovulum sp. TaxID=1872424 RepID=UPI001DC9EBB1|nr:hypothetical protein [Paracoccaceae bacterium]HPE24807.1 hypothetical protein [Albidovulum sp.]MCB2120735.1 hypothetical protein [Paracoccaceae bacterium]MCB2122195.1 hypothetical protein [Paracoccaceae bacterium]MCB2131353.1 hypothetical protein [Paracoccaceae bacterium]